jgi:succinate-semialdehyde dehydrogenase/glutarate-semialdehyde dehydrogenase
VLDQPTDPHRDLYLGGAWVPADDGGRFEVLDPSTGSPITTVARGLRISERLDSGMVGLNRGIVSDPAAPLGGTKQSGIGREGGHDGMLEYLESKCVAVQW